MPTLPSYHREHAALAQGYRLVAGIDEVGRGPLAGPVVAAAVILPAAWLRSSGGPQNNNVLDRRDLVRDSKQLSKYQRTQAYQAITSGARAWGVGSVPAEQIDAMGIVAATRVAMRHAIDALPAPPELLLVDFVDLSETGIPCEPIVHGDALCGVIAAASIVAKVTRDRFMEEVDRQFPDYNFGQHKGYATPEHLEALARLGPCPLHRKSFAPVRAALLQPRLL